jgi:hypothetical protein
MGGIVMEDETLRISKIEAASRQLDCAIELWFMDKDEVSVHTLAGAAYQIVHDLKVHRGIERELLYDNALIKDQYRNKWINLLKRAVNFFKHADRNPEGCVELRPVESLVFLMSAAAGLRFLGEQPSHAVNAFTFWMVINKPKWVTAEFRKLFEDRIGIDDLQELKVAPVPKKDFFEIYVRTSSRSPVIGRGNIPLD